LARMCLESVVLRDADGVAEKVREDAQVTLKGDGMR